MALTISTNVPSLNAQRNLSANQAGLATTMQRLSSGLRVNTAKDDAAGLAISERMLTQVKGMDAAKRNANDGISLAQVAEGSMQKMTDILQRGRELAVQAANGTNSRSDRQALFAEYSQLLQEFERMSQTANFNGHKLLDGSFTAQTFQVGANAGQTIDVSVPALKANTLGFHRTSSSLTGATIDRDWPRFQDFGQSGFDNWMTSIAAGATDRKLEIQGKELPIDGIWNVGEVARLINSQDFEPEIQATTEASLSFSALPNFSGQITLRLVAGEDYSKARSVSFAWDGSPTAALNAMDAINREASVTGVRAEKYFSDRGRPYFRLVNTEGENLHVMNDTNPSADIVLADYGWNEESGSVTTVGWTSPSAFPSTLGSGVFGTDDVYAVSALELVSDGAFTFKGDAKFDYDINGDEIRTGLIRGGISKQVALDDVSFTSTRKANEALQVFDAAINRVSSARAQLGAVQSRFGATIANLEISSENTAAARARIVDADFAQETAQLARQQILQNAGTAMVAQANAVPEQVLTLLKGM
ncbi:MAG: hypothetical protein ABS43_28390 [Bordetella sp. SCN 67-23]|uniref:flagellin N-terminal helical domain-containing protein n=1 Tax=Acidovorax sp. TaxID=1872122 RepID=UPI00086CDF82|nr:flagellin [Acidovorax sp.]MBN9628701.1 flagellin [Acidovorax sp.]ODS68356.1 MAG: hypothetical protein ABS43_28390 [Bordetella sp. SCN 67-23]